MPFCSFVRSRQLNYVGWLGYDNLGDIALFKAIRDVFSQYSYSLIPLKNCFGARILNPVTIIGGSTGIPDWIERLRFTKFNYIFGAGVKDPVFPGYNYIFKDDLKVKLMLDRLKFFRYIGVRGEKSRNQLNKWGIGSEVIGDPCFSLRPHKSIRRIDNRVVISVGSDGILWGMNEEYVYREISQVCRTLKKEGYEIILIPFWKENVHRVKKLSIEEQVKFFDDWFDVQKTLDYIASSKILIGEKLHSIGLSATAGTPFIGLEYQPKCRELAESVGFEEYMVRTDEISEKKVMSLFNCLLNNYEEKIEDLNQRIDLYREKQRNFAVKIVQDIDSTSDHFWRDSSFIKETISEIFWRADLLAHNNRILWKTWDQLLFSHFLNFFT